MITSKTKTIENHEVKTTLFPATKGMKMYIKLQQYIPLVHSMIEKAGGDSEELRTLALSEFLKHLDNDATIELVKELLSETTLDNVSLATNFDEAFAGEYNLLVSILMFALEVNFKLPLSEALG